MASLVDCMSTIKEDLLYTPSHEWIHKKNGTIRIGVTDYAQEHMTDVVFVELPAIGSLFSKGDELAIIESVKSISEIIAPVDGTISRVNEALENSPELVNESPYDEGWLLEMEVKDPALSEGLLSSEDYIKLTKE
jgi:glycine cleavage system H protein